MVVKFSASVMFAVFTAGCALNPYGLTDPTENILSKDAVETITRSIRCEVVTFIEANSLLSKVNEEVRRQNLPPSRLATSEAALAAVAFLKERPAIDIDGRQGASLKAEFRNVDTAEFGVTVGIDHADKSTVAGISHALGAKYTDAGAFGLVLPYVIPQYARLGPVDDFNVAAVALPKAIGESKVYAVQPAEDAAFYCFGSLSDRIESVDLFDAFNDLQSLSKGSDGFADYAQFRRIEIGGTTLSNWLALTGAEAVRNQQTIHPTIENILLGQIGYSFSLTATPSASYGFNLIAHQLNPLNISAGANRAHSVTFTIVFNTPYAKDALGASGGAATLDPRR